MSSPFDDLPVIFRYTRDQALADGVLVDLTLWAKELGFKSPVACSAAVWLGYITPPEAMRQWGQCERGRANDLLWLLHAAIRSHPGATDQLLYDVVFEQEPEKSIGTQFKAVCGPGDEGEPAITIMLTTED